MPRLGSLGFSVDTAQIALWDRPQWEVKAGHFWYLGSVISGNVPGSPVGHSVAFLFTCIGVIQELPNKTQQVILQAACA